MSGDHSDFSGFSSRIGSEFDFDVSKDDSEDDIKERVADNIIKIFKVKRPVRFIDKDSDKDVISYEESEERLIILLANFSFCNFSDWN